MSRILGMMKNVRNWPAYLLHKWGVSKQEPFILLGQNDVSLEVPARMMHTVKEVFFADDYRFDEFEKTLRDITAKPVIVDVGANVGYMSAFTFCRFPEAKVFSVEPLPKNLELLYRNRERNTSFDWEVFEGVLSSNDGSVEITYDASDSFSTSASIVGLDHGVDLLSVRSARLDSFMTEQKLDRIHVLKLDCEGAEYDILYSLNEELLNAIAFVTMETHQVDDDSKNCDALLTWFAERGWKTHESQSKVLAENPNFQ